MSCVVTEAGVSFEGDLWELLSQISVLCISHPGGFFVIYNVFSSLTIKKKKSYLLIDFWLQTNSRWYILYREKK